MKIFSRTGSAPQLPIKIHEILFVWLAIIAIWYFVWDNILTGIPNIECVQWGFSAITIVWLSKYFLRRENCPFDRLIGTLPMSAAVFAELGAVLFISLLAGIGGFSVLILLSAKINAGATYERWHFVTNSTFDEIQWIKSWFIAYLIAISVLAPIIEEIVFRGFILRRLREKYPVGKAIVFSALLFSVLHFDKSFIGVFLNGITLAILAVKFSSLYAPMIVHGLYNAAALTSKCYFGAFFVADINRINSIKYWMPELACFLIGTIGVVYYLRSNIATLRSHSINPS